MIIQIIFLVLFALNLLSIWATVFLKKCEWYRIPGFVIVVLIPLLTVFFDQPRFELDFFWWRIAGVALAVLGIAILIWARFDFNLQRQVRRDGPYQYVRHPQYLGMIFIYAGWWWIWSAVYSFYLGMFILAMVWLQAYLEEKLILEKLFADQYREYRLGAGMFWIK